MRQLLLDLLYTTQQRLSLSPTDLLRDTSYRRLWYSVLISTLARQVTLLGLPLTAAVLLHASPMQIGFFTTMEMTPFLVFSLPSGVLLDHVHKLPVYLGGETLLVLIVASVPFAWWMGWLTMSWMYVVAFMNGTISTIVGIASQVVLMQVITRGRLVEAQVKNALARSFAEVGGPSLIGAFISLVGTPLALLLGASALLASTLILCGIKVHEMLLPCTGLRFWYDLKTGVRFIFSNRLLVALFVTVGVFCMCQSVVLVIQILYATRTLNLSAQGIGLSYTSFGVGTVFMGLLGRRISACIGPGPCLVLAFATCGVGWGLVSLTSSSAWSIAAFTLMLMLYGIGAMLICINFHALCQSVTPDPLLGRMTSTMSWLILLPTGPGALIGGWLGEHVGLRAAFAFASVVVLLLALVVWCQPLIRVLRELPKIEVSSPEAARRPSETHDEASRTQHL